MDFDNKKNQFAIENEQSNSMKLFYCQNKLQ